MSPHQLLEIHDTSPGYSRKKEGKSWKYFDKDKQISDKKIIQRINNLKIVPSWTDVWICKQAQGYLQATGYDEAQRKQYIYHQKWHQYRSEKKLERMLDFKQNLNKIRKTIRQDLETIDSYTKSSVCALALWMIDKGRLRLGNWHYHQKYETTGTITLEKNHVFENYLKFIGKSNKERQIPIDETWDKYLNYCFESPGQTLLTYWSGKNWESLSATDVRDHLKDLSKDTTPKDFRTWWAEVEFVHTYYLSLQQITQPNKSKIVSHVAQILGHTPTVCRKFYITKKAYEKIDDLTLDTLDHLFKTSRSTTYCSRAEQFTQKVLSELVEL